MLLDIRTYRCKPGTINAHLELYEKMGKPPQFPLLGRAAMLSENRNWRSKRIRAHLGL